MDVVMILVAKIHFISSLSFSAIDECIMIAGRQNKLWSSNVMFWVVLGITRAHPTRTRKEACMGILATRLRFCHPMSCAIGLGCTEVMHIVVQCEIEYLGCSKGNQEAAGFGRMLRVDKGAWILGHFGMLPRLGYIYITMQLNFGSRAIF
ncbi:hypothetical protein RHMOL_Rhmol05G0120800 [Rhododendron molle]|uniref:Uncharacterized protein n=1 Tax=Rhododendron molle TaxID=49168 RepID=A0ACC0NQ49_RHOML|nr:hypothetical protein RHMOL_Rhmol05G0120800 [Rhododendron molle]